MEMRSGMERSQGELAFGQLSGCSDAFFAQCFAVELTVKVFPCLSIADATHGWHSGVQVATFTQFAELLQLAGHP